MGTAGNQSPMAQEINRSMIDINNPPQPLERLEKAHRERVEITCGKCHRNLQYVHQCVNSQCPLKDDGK